LISFSAKKPIILSMHLILRLAFSAAKLGNIVRAKGMVN